MNAVSCKFMPGKNIKNNNRKKKKCVSKYKLLRRIDITI